MLKQQGKTHLENSELFRSLDSHELDMLLAYNDIITFAKDDEIIQQGKRGAGIYIVFAGEIRIIAKTLSEGVTEIETLGPGSILGEISFIGDVVCTTSAIANSDVSCLLINETYFNLLGKHFPETKHKILLTVAKQVVSRLQFMHKKIASYITSSDMQTKSLFGDVIQSLTTITKLSQEEMAVEVKEFVRPEFLPIFTPEEKQILLRHEGLYLAPKHCNLIKVGESQAPLYIVIRGAVQSSIIESKKVAKLSVIGPTLLFASVSSVDHSVPSITNYLTCETTIILRITAEEAAQLEKENPKLWFKLFHLICKSLVALERSIDKLDIRLNVEKYNR